MFVQAATKDFQSNNYHTRGRRGYGVNCEAVGTLANTEYLENEE